MNLLTPQEQEEVEELFAASFARNDALRSRQRFDAGEFSIDLVRVADDPSVENPEFQSELRKLAQSLKATGVTFTQTGLAFDDVDGAGYQLAEFIIKSLNVPLIVGAAHVFAAWVKAKSGRRIRLKCGDVVAEAHTIEDIERLMHLAAVLCDAKSKKGKKDKDKTN